MSLNQTLQEAVRLHQAGRFAEAEQRYRQILVQAPKQPDALQLLGVLAHQHGRHEMAVKLIAEAIQQRPTTPEFHNNLGQALEALRRWDEASASYRQAVKLKPTYPEAHNNLANMLRRAGQRAEAAAGYRRAIELQPHYGEAYNNLGLVLADEGRFDEAIAAFQQAIRCRGEMPEFHLNLGLAQQKRRDRAAAGQSYRRALELNPDFAEARNNYAVFLHETGRSAEALAELDRVTRARPNYAEAFYNRALVLKEIGELIAAMEPIQQALAVRPNYADAHNLLGNILRAAGRNAEAIAAYARAIALNGDKSDYYNNLGNALYFEGKSSEAIVALQTALHLDPKNVEAHSNLGNVYQLQNQLAAAIQKYRDALALDANFASAHNNLGNIFKDQGDLDEAIACYRRAIAINPHRSAYHNLLFALHYHPAYGPAQLAEEHRRWRVQCADPLRSTWHPHANDRNPDRPLRIGYVSADFREHAVSRFLLPLLRQHNHGHFQVHCFASVSQPDARTRQFQALPVVWHDIIGCTDEQAAEVIRQRSIDILVDLGAHTSETRVLIFARKPAPVQVTWLAYAGSTGLDSIDYRFTDPVLDPPGEDESIYSEKCHRLPDTYWCCDPPSALAEVSPLPALARGMVTFGCLNNFCKISDPIKDCWAQILLAVPRSTLLVHAHPGSHRDRFREFFAAHGVAPNRIEFVGKQSMADYLGTYRGFDIALDPYPFGGGTTTCDALWMGLPVVSLRGVTAVSRAGATLLANVGLSALAVDSPAAYVQAAVSLAGDLEHLGRLRTELRAKMLGSPLMNAPRFARNIEEAYRQLWRRWCETT